MAEIRRTFVIPSSVKETDTMDTTDASKMKNMLFADFMIHWLDVIKPNVTLNTFSGYNMNVKKIIAPYFREKGVTLGNLQPADIQKFYSERLKVVKANSVQKYHANIRKALTYAVKMDYIQVNPIFKVEKPKKNAFIGSFYSVEEIEKLFEAAKGTYLEIPVLLGAFYGFRRSEIVGLRWKMIDFDEDTITINHTITVATIDGERHIMAEDRAKTKSSLRTLPLVAPVKEKLIALKEQQDFYRKKSKNLITKIMLSMSVLMKSEI